MNSTERRGFVRAVKDVLEIIDDRIADVRLRIDDAEDHGESANSIELQGALYALEGLRDETAELLKAKTTP